MLRSVKGLLRWALVLLVAGCALWFGIKWYYSYVHPVADLVRQDVRTRIQTDRSRYVSYKDIPPMYRSAVISAEDQSFFTNIGVDIKGIVRALFRDLAQGKVTQGGSTITQQLVHNTLLKNRVKSWHWKVHEIVDAIGLYDTMRKQEIFELYANDIYFGHGAYGLYAAAETYFGRTPGQLNDGELTMLAGLPNAPSDYDPFRDIALARQRQQLVLQSMINHGVLSSRNARQIFLEPIRLKSHPK